MEKPRLSDTQEKMSPPNTLILVSEHHLAIKKE